MKIQKQKLFIFLSVILLLSGCEKAVKSFDESARSGTVANDDVEAPLTENAKQYANALELSNKFLSLWEEKNFQKIHDEMVDSEVKEALSVEKLADIYKNVEESYGALVSYKKGQWAFEPKSAKKQYFLWSIKYVTHKKRKMNYLFEFVLDGEYKKLAGFYVREKPAKRAPGQIHNNIQ